jgi:hypothetical protein
MYRYVIMVRYHMFPLRVLLQSLLWMLFDVGLLYAEPLVIDKDCMRSSRGVPLAPSLNKYVCQVPYLLY